MAAAPVAGDGSRPAVLLDLDGTLVQTVPLFRLPGLSTGAILVQADLAKSQAERIAWSMIRALIVSWTSSTSRPGNTGKIL